MPMADCEHIRIVILRAAVLLALTASTVVGETLRIVSWNIESDGNDHHRPITLEKTLAP